MTDLARPGLIPAPPVPRASGADLLAPWLERVDEELQSLLRAESARWSAVDPDLRLGFELLSDFIARGGKRLRPSFCLLAFLGTGGTEDGRSLRLAAAIEMLHTFALVHDDVMDGSETRRHAPTLHQRLATEHQRRAWRGEQRRVAEGMAVLVGDLAFVYADRLMAGMPDEVIELFNEMRVELHVGQYLDMLGAATAETRQGRADQVIRYKTASYSVERPLQLGAALAGGLAGRSPLLSRFGLAVGEAFQLRDDLLGVFGDPVTTGKPQGDDLREGKQTVLIAHTREWALTRRDATVLHLLDRLGRPDLTLEDGAAIRAALIASGAVDATEHRITSRMAEAERALDGLALTEPAADALWSLARQCAWRAA